MKQCPHCDTENKLQARFCRSCGKEMVDGSVVENSAEANATRRLSDTPISNATKRLPESNATRRILDVADPNATRRVNVPPPPVLEATQRFQNNTAKPNFPPPPPPRTQPPPTFTPPKSSLDRRKMVVAGGSVVGVLTLVGIGWLLWRLFSGVSGSQLLVGFPDRSGDFELYALKPGESEREATALYEDVAFSSIAYYLTIIENEEAVSSISNRDSMAAFLPSSDQMLLFYQDDDELVFVQRDNNSGDIVKIIDSQYPLYVNLYADKRMMAIREDRSDEFRCYAAPIGEEAQRVAKGDGCFFTIDGSTLFSYEDDADQYILTASDINGDNELELLDLETTPSLRYASDGSHVAYVRSTDDGEQLFLLDRNDASENAISPMFFSIATFGFAAKQDKLFYIAETDDGELQLYSTSSSEVLAEATYLSALTDEQGDNIIYLAGDELDELTAYIVDSGGGTPTEIVAGENLSIALAGEAGRIIVHEVTEDEDHIIYSSDLNGKNVVKLFDEEVDFRVLSLSDEGDLLLISYIDSGKQSLFVSPLDKAEGYIVIDEFYSYRIQQYSADGRWMLFSGQEDSGDDHILYSVDLREENRPNELEDDLDGVLNAIFSQNNRLVFYTAVTGSGRDDMSVHQVDYLGEDPPQKLFDEARLFDTQWGNGYETQYLFTQSAHTGSSPCPGAEPLAIGADQDSTLEADSTFCVRLSASAGDVLTFDTLTDRDDGLDTWISILDRDGTQLSYNDDYTRGQFDSRVSFYVENDGVFFANVGNQNSNKGDVTLAVTDGVKAEGFENARELIADETVRDAITSEHFYAVWDSDVPADSYYFNAEAGDQITIDVKSPSIGGELDPGVYLFNLGWATLREDDDSGDGYDAKLTYSIEQSGRYYVAVYSRETGSEETHFYEITLTKR